MFATVSGNRVSEALASAIDAVAAVDTTALADAELADAVAELVEAEGRLAAQRARLLAAAEARQAWPTTRYPTCSAWLAHRTRIEPARARREVRLARTLRTMPHTAAALADGVISLDAARAIARRWRPRLASALLRDEATLVGQAGRLDVVDLERVLRSWEQHAEPDGVEQRAAARAEDRRFAASVGIDGVFFDGWLPTTTGAVVRNELDRLEHQLFLDDWKDARARWGDDATPAHLRRTGAQRRADALVEMATRSATMPAGGRRPAPLFTVLVGYETFAGRICQLAAGQVLTPGEAAALLDEAVVERVVFDGPSRVIDVGQSRLFTGALRRAIQVRDQTCTHDGCHVPAERCEIDHVIPAAVHGPTSQDNGVLRCPFHHHQRHRPARPPPP
jgi:hypothetical protein